MTDDVVRPQPPVPLSKEHRRAERARLTRLGRLPFLYDLGQRSRGGAVLAGLVQTLLVVVPVLVGAKAVTGSWLPPGVALVALVVALAVQAVSRYLNARAGRG